MINVVIPRVAAAAEIAKGNGHVENDSSHDFDDTEDF
jgi:hypothetical protein